VGTAVAASSAFAAPITVITPVAARLPRSGVEPFEPQIGAFLPVGYP
jgi:hypothetical protein